jgi:hypothetical protein
MQLLVLTVVVVSRRFTAVFFVVFFFVVIAERVERTQATHSKLYTGSSQKTWFLATCDLGNTLRRLLSRR